MYKLFLPIRMMVIALGLGISFPLAAQDTPHPIASEVSRSTEAFRQVERSPLFRVSARQQSLGRSTGQEVKQAMFLDLEERAVAELITRPEELLMLDLPTAEGTLLRLKMTRADVFSESFQLRIASDPTRSYPYQGGVYYWGIVNDDEGSLAAIAIHRGEIMGTISTREHTYTLGRLAETTEATHMLYKKEALKVAAPYSCQTDDERHLVGAPRAGRSTAGQNNGNCVRMYVEVDHDIVLEKGGVTAAADYVSGAFSQVAMLYANESINFVLNELFVWDVEDPYTGSSTSDFLYAFRDRLDGNYNGDLAHLVGNKGSGGVAYVDVLCNKRYGVGYSGIGSTYRQVPTYSWTVEVLTHEIGHNLGSQHTHACAWNGNNTAIDGCGPAYGINEGCDAPVPDKGTIMSYCHLLQGVGIDFNLGFGPQPGDRIRDRVYSASCLTSCATSPSVDAGITEIVAPGGYLCESSAVPQVTLTNFGTEALSQVTIDYRVDNNATLSYVWSGNLPAGDATAVTLPVVSFGVGVHNFYAETRNPNGQPDENTANDATTDTFTHMESNTYYRDADGDGYGNPQLSTTDCTQPTGYVLDNSDCNDTSASAYPGAPCDDGDDCTVNDVLGNDCNCSGTPTPGGQTWYADNDGDGYGNPSVTVSECTQPSGYVADNTDCNDNDAAAYPGAPCNDGDDCTVNDVLDSNCDCTGTFTTDADGDGVCAAQDPDDNDACVPYADPVLCPPCTEQTTDDFEAGFGNWNDGGDDCALSTSYALNSNYSIRLRDNSGMHSSMYTNPMDLSSYVSVQIDFAFYPSSMEAGEKLLLEVSTDGGSNFAVYRTWTRGTDFLNNQWYQEQVEINDVNFTQATVFRLRCDASAITDYIYIDDVVITTCSDTCVEGTACDDGDDCTIDDKLDSNCNCVGTPAPDGQTWYADNDGDGYGDPNVMTTSCNQPEGYVADNTDCNDNDAGAHPGAPCNDGDDCTVNDVMDSNCNCAGTPTPDGQTWYADNDGDGYGNPNVTTVACAQPNGYVATNTDCNDNDAGAYPGAPCNDGDDCTINDVMDSDCNCSGVTTADADGDGYCAAQDPDDNNACVPDSNSPLCLPCSDLISDDFETDLGNWNDGGDDCMRSTSYALSGSYSIRLRDNSGVHSSMYTNPMDLSAYASVQFDFAFYPSSMEAGEKLLLEVSTDGGSNFVIYRSWARGADFQNHQWYQEQVAISDVTFTQSTVFRLRCDASANTDFIYVDNVLISSCSTTCTVGTPCDDGDDCTINDQLDNNCNCVGTPAPDGQTWYADNDGDGYGNPNVTTTACNQPNGYVADNTDCNDSDAGAYPGAPCNDGDSCTTNDVLDSNCNCAGTPTPDGQTWYADNDGDGYGNPNVTTTGCDQPNGYVADNTDCNDSDAGAYPGAPCNDGDNCTINDVLDSDCNCSGNVTEDADGDGYCAAEDPDDNNACVPDNNSPACAACSDLLFDDFEAGYGNWIDGGSDCALSTTYSMSGSYSVRLRDNSGRYSSMYTVPMDLSAYPAVQIDFFYYPFSMDGGESFRLEVSTDGGATYTTYRSWTREVDFSNNNWYEERVVISGIPFTQSTVLRFLCDASANSDNIFIDDIKISSCITGSSSTVVTQPETSGTSSDDISVYGEDDIRLYPNPAAHQAILAFDRSPVDATVTVHNLLGNRVARYQVAAQSQLRLPIQEWGSNGQMFLVTVEIDGQEPIVKKLMVVK